MGVDTKVLLTDPPEILEILRYAEDQYKGAVLTCTKASEIFWLKFTDGEDIRQLAIFPKGVCASDYADVCNTPAILISMGCWGNSEAVARRMAIKWGGMIMPNDCTDDWQNVTPQTAS